MLWWLGLPTLKNEITGITIGNYFYSLMSLVQSRGTHNMEAALRYVALNKKLINWQTRITHADYHWYNYCPKTSWLFTSNYCNASRLCMVYVVEKRK